MAQIGGSIDGVSFDGRAFSVPADQEVNRKIGGFENEVLANGDGTARLIKTRVPFSLDGLGVGVDDARGDQAFLQELANGGEFFAVTITYASGVVFQGTGQIVGELTFSNQSASATVSLMGTGELTAQ
jgi:hypothetical protein